MSNKPLTTQLHSIYTRLHKIMVENLLTDTFDDQDKYIEQLNKLAELMNIIILLIERLSERETLLKSIGMTD